MIKLDQTLRAWGTPKFEVMLKQEIAQYAGQPPLQQGLTTGNYMANEPITVAIISIAELENAISLKAGIFYKGVIGECSCTDDPTHTSEINEYCEVRLDIDKTTAATAVLPVPK